MDDFKKSLEPMARVRVKSSLVIEKITEKIDPEVTDEEDLAEAYPVVRLRQAYQWNSIQTHKRI